MKKICNLRLPVLGAAVLAAGIVYSAVLAFFGSDGIFVLLPSLVMCVISVAVGIITRRARISVYFLVFGIVFLIGAIYAYAKYVSFCQTEVPLGEFVKVSGRVVESGVTSNGNNYIIISDASVGGVKINGKIIAYLSENSGDYCRRGYTVDFYAPIEKQNFFEYGSISYRAVENIKYYCSVTVNLKSQYKFSLFGEINYAIESALFDNLDKETAAVAFALITGNTQEISGETLSAFRNGGVAHVFAVSGLHIGVVYACLTFIFKKARVNKYVSVVLRIFAIAVYCGVCGFSTSSVRAVIMCSVIASADCLQRKYDGWNSLSVAAILLLLINPFNLFAIGFALSFGSILGIVLLSGSFKRVFYFLSEKLRGILSISLSTQVATVPALLSTFGYVSWAGLLLNLIFIPVISAVYVMLFCVTLISAVFPLVAAYVLPIACVPLQFIINVIWECGFENAVIYANYSNWIYVPFLILMFGLSQRFNLRCIWRGAFIVSSAVAIIFFSVAGASAHKTNITFNAGYNGGYAFISTESGTVMIVTDNFEGRVGGQLEDVDELVVVGGEDCLSVIIDLGGNFKKVHLGGNKTPVPSMGIIELDYEDNFEACGVKFAFENGALFAESDGVTIAVTVAITGDIYGEGLQNADFNLYAYDSDGAVLFTKNESYGLSVCGEMRYGIINGRIVSAYAVPKE
ncbi:MAG: ComEC/Rec2 family competence protein [Clostridia bacterium]|nr:ComEC/Rec2 family competence protein [Clostridia bacterium]